MMLRTIFALTGSFLALVSCSAGSGAPFGSAPETSANANLVQRSTSQGGSFKASYPEIGIFTPVNAGRSAIAGSSTAPERRVPGLEPGKRCGAGWFRTGSAMLRESSSKQDFIRVHVSGAFCSPHLAFTVSGGSGIFKDATGSGTIHFSCTGTKRGTYKDNWSGTIYY